MFVSPSYAFVELTFIKWSTGARRWATVQQQITKGIEVSYRSGGAELGVGEELTYLEGPHGEVKVECRWRQDQGHKPLLGCVCGVHWGSCAKSKLANLKQINGGLISRMGLYLRGVQEEGTVKCSHCWALALWGSHLRNLQFLLSLQAAVWFMCLQEGLMSV